MVLSTRCFAARMGKDCGGRPPRPGQRGTGIAARGLEQREVAEGHGNIGVFRTEDLFAERKRALIQRLRLVIAALRPIDIGQLIEGVGEEGMLLGERLLSDRERALIQLLRLAVAAL